MRSLLARSGRLGPALLLGGLLLATPVFAQTEGDRWERDKWESRGGRFAVGAGFVYARFDTNAKFTDKTTDLSVFVDAEGSLGLPETDAVPVFYGGYNFSKRHSLVFSYFQIRRDVTIVDDDFEFEGIHLDGSATLQDRTRFYNLSYGNTLFRDERSRVRLTFGVYGLDLDYTLEALGTITIGEEPELEVLDEEASVLAPLPVIGFEFWFALTPKWSLNPSLSFVGGSYQDVSARVLATRFSTRYQFTRSLGMLFGISYFNADVKIEDDEERTDVSYGYDGVFLGLHVVF